MAALWIVFGVLVLLAGAGLLIWSRYQSLPMIANQLDHAWPWMMVWRLTVYVLVIGGWPRWVAGLGRRYDWTAAFSQQLLQLRWRLAGWLVVLELLLAWNLVGHFLRTLSG